MPDLPDLTGATSPGLSTAEPPLDSATMPDFQIGNPSPIPPPFPSGGPPSRPMITEENGAYILEDPSMTGLGPPILGGSGAPPFPPPASTQEITSATIAIGEAERIALRPDSTQHLSSAEFDAPLPGSLKKGGTVTMMAPPVGNVPGRRAFDTSPAVATTPTAPEAALEDSIDLDSDSEVKEKMPYLFGPGSGTGMIQAPTPEPGQVGALGGRVLAAMTGILKAPPPPTSVLSAKAAARPPGGLGYEQAMGDAVVPGGAAHSPDTETLKKYLMLREQDVAVLSTQLRTMQEQLAAMEEQVRMERARASELSHLVQEQAKRISDFDREKTAAVDEMQSEIDEVKFQLRARSDKGKLVEGRMREKDDEIDRLKERVRSDIRKIRVHEKELENRLEILKKDSEALIAARESKIIELKRKVDLLEFNMDLLQNQQAKEKENSANLRERLAKAAQIVRVAGGLLDSEGKATLEHLTSIDSGRDSAPKKAAS